MYLYIKKLNKKTKTNEGTISSKQYLNYLISCERISGAMTMKA